MRRASSSPTALARDWWIVGVRGVFAVLFGVAALLWPAITLGAFVLLFGAYAFADGIFAIASAVRGRAWVRRAWPVLLEGVVSATLGVLAWTFPMIPRRVLYLIAAWGIATGVLELAAAIGMARDATKRWLLGLSGLLSVLLGTLLLVLPQAGDRHVVTVVGIYAVAFGGLLVAAAFRLRDARRLT